VTTFVGAASLVASRRAEVACSIRLIISSASERESAFSCVLRGMNAGERVGARIGVFGEDNVDPNPNNFVGLGDVGPEPNSFGFLATSTDNGRTGFTRSTTTGDGGVLVLGLITSAMIGGVTFGCVSICLGFSTVFMIATIVFSEDLILTEETFSCIGFIHTLTGAFGGAL
jgi:hypothetical protein